MTRYFKVSDEEIRQLVVTYVQDKSGLMVTTVKFNKIEPSPYQQYDPNATMLIWADVATEEYK